MKRVSSISKLPTCPAVYAMYGGKGRGGYVAYVGTSESLKQRMGQHLVTDDEAHQAESLRLSLEKEANNRVFG